MTSNKKLQGAKKVIKNALFSMSPAKVVLGVLVVIGFVIFVFARTILGAFSASSAFTVLTILTIILLVARLSVFVKVGINIFTILLFCVQLVFGIWITLLMFFITTALYLVIATRPTPIDFAITKGVQNALAQSVYVTLWLISLAVLFHFLSLQFILSHFVLSYMISIFFYIFFMVIFLPMLAQEPVPLVCINGMMMCFIQFFVGKYIGVMFLQFLLSL